MAREAEVSNDFVIPRAAARASQFLGVIQRTCDEEGLDLHLRATKRSMRDSTVVLRADIKAGRGNQLELEVFADPQGNALHVGWQATRQQVGGALANVGMFAEMNYMASRNAGKAGNQRALSGILQAFDGMVFQPVVQQLTEAVQAESGPRQNGFLGA